MFNPDSLYRWCDGYGGGLVFAESIVDAREKLTKYLDEERDPNKLTIWPWHLDDYYDEENLDVLDIYGV